MSDEYIRRQEVVDILRDIAKAITPTSALEEAVLRALVDAAARLNRGDY